MNISYRTEIPDKNEYFHLFQSTGWNSNDVWTRAAG
ncbi:hypothetical protein J2Z66_008333 [Paenibacillus eucommiae]|uniref:Uncharacterized protein n=1 Tax=Paenibacillus eucommiae TaxID=1355755 RepID=A0ABS4JBV8_9BACL|nr:hypothetical protein [Paenibacillus eucommiae]